MKYYLFLLLLILLNSIILQKKKYKLEEKYYSFDISSARKKNMTDITQDISLQISKNKYKSFNTKIKKLNDNRKNNKKIIDKRKKENNNLRKEISKLEDKFVKLKQY